MIKTMVKSIVNHLKIISLTIDWKLNNPLALLSPDGSLVKRFHKKKAEPTKPEMVKAVRTSDYSN